jgi:hypothetical protein
MKKQYRVIKQLPDIDAGVILIKEDDIYPYVGKFDHPGERSWYTEEVVENNPEFFEEVKPFVWDESKALNLVWFIWYYKKDVKPSTFDKVIKEFLQHESEQHENNRQQTNHLPSSRRNDAGRHYPS